MNNRFRLEGVSKWNQNSQHFDSNTPIPMGISSGLNGSFLSYIKPLLVPLHPKNLISVSCVLCRDWSAQFGHQLLGLLNILWLDNHMPIVTDRDGLLWPQWYGRNCCMWLWNASGPLDIPLTCLGWTYVTKIFLYIKSWGVWIGISRMLIFFCWCLLELKKMTEPD